MERKKIDKWDAMISFDEKEKIYVICYDGEGGAIISDENLKVAESKFIEAMYLAEGVNKLLHFNERGTFPPKT
jgi:hypothetical protein